MQCCGSMCFRLPCVYWVPCSVSRTLYCTQYTNRNLKHMPQHRKTQGKPHEDGPNGPKHVGANIRYLNVNFNILFVCLIKGEFVGKKKRNFDIIKMHGTTIKKLFNPVFSLLDIFISLLLHVSCQFDMVHMKYIY